MIVYLVESGRDDPAFEALLSSKQAALAMLAAQKSESCRVCEGWRVRAIEVDGDIVGTAQWSAKDWAASPREWEINEDLP